MLTMQSENILCKHVIKSYQNSRSILKLKQEPINIYIFSRKYDLALPCLCYLCAAVENWNLATSPLTTEV